MSSDPRDVLEACEPDMSVLIVDDVPENVRLLERILQRIEGLRVTSTNSSLEALRLYQSDRPDIVLLDLHMPEMDGIELLQALQRATDTDDFVPCVVLTADVSREARTAALRHGAHDYLLKPLDPTEVVLRTRNLLRARALHVRLAANRRQLADELARREEAEIADSARRDSLRAEITGVIESRSVEVVFQPIVDLQNGRVVGAEALSRFPTDRSRGPDSWFADANEVGLGPSLELLAIEMALDRLDDLPNDTFLSVNLSPSALSSGLDTMRRSHDPTRLVAELTEHAVILDYSAIIAKAAEHRASGVRLAVDDAGAGFASLHHVLALRPDFIKLDMGLTRGIAGDPVRRSLTAALVRFAREVGAELVAEGIETADELSALQSLGVGLGQGYYLSRPTRMPVPDRIAGVRSSANR